MSSEGEGDELYTKLSQQVTEVDGCKMITWVSSSVANDEDGTPTQLVSVVTEVRVEAFVEVVSASLSDQYSCELWGSAPAILPLRPIDGYDQYLIPCDKSSVTFDSWAYSTMKEWGMFVQRDLVAADEVVQLRQYALDEIDNAESLLKLHRPQVNIGQDIMAFREIASRGNERFDLLLGPWSMACQFVSNNVIERISRVLEKLIGSVHVEVDCDMSIVYSKPGAPNQGWHADGDHQKGASDAGWDKNGWQTHLSDPYALCLFVPLIDLDDDTGYTQFWPASHRNKGLMGFGALAEIAQATWDGKCKAGDAIWYDYRLMHRGMRNASTLLRPVLQLLFRSKWYVEKRNYGEESVVLTKEDNKQ